MNTTSHIALICTRCSAAIARLGFSICLSLMCFLAVHGNAKGEPSRSYRGYQGTTSVPACDSPHRTTGQSSCSCCKATARLRRTKPIVHVAIDVSGSLGPLRGKHWTELRDEAAKTIAAGSNWRLSTFGETDSCYDTGRPVSGNAPVSGALDERHRLARGLGNRNRTPVLRVVREHARANPDVYKRQ